MNIFEEAFGIDVPTKEFKLTERSERNGKVYYRTDKGDMFYMSNLEKALDDHLIEFDSETMVVTITKGESWVNDSGFTIINKKGSRMNPSKLNWTTV